MTVPAPTAVPEGTTIEFEAARRIAVDAVHSGQLPCAVFGVVGLDGMRGIHAVSGRRSTVRPDSIFFIASVTKAIVATAVMQYVDEGRLDLHAPLARYVPEFSDEGREAVTAWHVLTHTSGLPDMRIETLRRERPNYQRSLEHALARTPAWPPGSRYEYNSAAWMLLAETMSRLSAMPFPETVRVRLTQPLGMVDTTFDPRHARARIRPMNGFAIRNRLMEEVLLRFLIRATLPGGGMFGTVADLLRLGRALLPAAPTTTAAADGSTVAGPRILSQAAIDEMARLQTAGIPQLLEDGSRREIHQAIGWRKPTQGWPDEPRAFTHGGISGSRLWVDPARGLAFAFLTNLWEAPDEPAQAILEAVYRAWP